ncbi:MAG: hypothetical protein Kow0031_37080 [Anaerolineae bacterium]
MLILKCTQKAAKEFGEKPQNLPQLSPESNTTLLGDWFANMFRMGHSKYMLFTNAETLYSFLVEYKKSDLADISEFFRFNLEFSLFDEGFSNEQIDRLLAEYGEVRLAKTDNRSVLGSMNDMVMLYKYIIMDMGGPKEADLAQAIREINRTPQLKRNGIFPNRMLREKLESQ